MKYAKIDQKGIAHLLAPIAFMAVFALIGGVVILRGHAATQYVGLLGVVEVNGTTTVGNAKVILKRPDGSYSYDYTNAYGQYGFTYLTVGKTYTVRAQKTINNRLYCGGPTTFVASWHSNGEDYENFTHIDPSKC